MKTVDDAKENIKANIRRYKSSLIISGTGYIAFGIWSVLKSIIQITLGAESELFKSLMSEDLNMPEFINVRIFIFSIVIVILLLIFFVHWYIGMGAVKYGRGTSRKKGFLLFAIPAAIFSIAEIPNLFKQMIEAGRSTLDTTLVACIMNLTMVWILADMMYSAYKLKKLESSDTGSETPVGSEQDISYGG